MVDIQCVSILKHFSKLRCVNQNTEISCNQEMIEFLVSTKDITLML